MIQAHEITLLSRANRALGRLEVGCSMSESQNDLDVLSQVIDAYTELLLAPDESEHVPVPAPTQAEQLGELIQIVSAEQAAAVPARKPCNKCGVVKSLDKFPKNNACRDGRTGTCKVCAVARARINRAEKRATAEPRSTPEPVQEPKPRKLTGRYIDTYGCIWLIDAVSGANNTRMWTCWKEEPTGSRSMCGEVLGSPKWRKTREDAQAALDLAARSQRNWTAEVNVAQH